MFSRQLSSFFYRKANKVDHVPTWSRAWTCPYLSVSLLSASWLSVGHALPPPQGHYTEIAPAWGPTCDVVVVRAHLVACNAPMTSVMKQVGSEATFRPCRLPRGIETGWVCIQALSSWTTSQKAQLCAVASAESKLMLHLAPAPMQVIVSMRKCHLVLAMSHCQYGGLWWGGITSAGLLFHYANAEFTAAFVHHNMIYDLRIQGKAMTAGLGLMALKACC